MLIFKFYVGRLLEKNILIQPNVAAPLFSLCLNALCWCLSL